MNLWMSNVRKVTPYVAGEQPQNKNVVKLNTNENPYPPAPEVQELMDNYDADIMRKYPDPDVTKLVNALADYHGVGHDQVFVGVGSDDVISVAFLTFFASDKPILFPDITYAFYPVWADLYRIPYRTPAVDADFRIVASDYEQENGGIVIPNPNAPTSIYEGLDFIEGILKKNPSSMVIIDEAYVDFAGESALKLLECYDNLLIVRTFSKSRSMAGMRIGYAIGRPEAIAAMNSIKASINSYTMSHIAIDTGVASVNDDAYFKKTVAKIVETRENAKKRLKEIGFSGPDSQSNFLFVKHESIPGGEIFKKLREKNIFVRYFSKPRIDDYLRITIGTPEEMEKLYTALQEIISER
ncbi:MAG: histidinol-phosphate transaminase [Lachnospiraceae bacterium]|nr:histidinol-phosphate transaminase [Lachnospiraceae bacterium]